jgi:hypothetical protein
MYSIFYLILFIILLLLSYVIYDKYKYVLQEQFQNEEEKDIPKYDLTEDSIKLDKRFNFFEDAKKYIKAPKSSKCFKSQFSRELLNPENKILPHLYFTDANKKRSRIINVDVFKKNILDKIVYKFNNEELEKGDYKEIADPKLSYFKKMEFTAVDKDVFNNIANKIKTHLDSELKQYVQNLSPTSADIKCDKDMSDCKSNLWNPGIIRIRKNEEYYEYIFQLTYYIHRKAYAYVLIAKCYVNIQNPNFIFINMLNLIGLEHEQNIMLTPGYSKTQLDNRVNIYSDYPYTPYEANMTYYRSSNEDTFIRGLQGTELSGSRLNFTDEDYIQSQLDKRDQIQVEMTTNPPICMTDEGEVLKYDTKEDCEAATDDDGNPKKSAIFDNKCAQDSDCPFYLGNKNYQNSRGGCKDDGFCELPVNVQSLAYKDYYDKYTYFPYCYGCPNDKMESCCEIQRKIINGTATETEIEEHTLVNVNLASPDYAFVNDFDERLTAQEDLNSRNIEVN